LKEQNAWTEFRFDIFATLVFVVLSGNLLYVIIDAFVNPLPIASNTLSLLSFDLESWRDEIGDRDLERDCAAPSI